MKWHTFILVLIGLAALAVGLSFLPGKFGYQDTVEYEYVDAPDETVIQETDTNENVVLDDVVILNNPKRNQIINGQVVIEGEARGTMYFEGSFPLEIRDGEGNSIARGFAQMTGDTWMTADYVPFRSVLYLQNIGNAEVGELVLRNNNPSDNEGTRIEVSMPIRLVPATSTREISVYFSKMITGTESCDTVAAAPRTIPLNESPAREALYALLSGPISSDYQQSLSSNIPFHVELLGLRINNGVAYADFSQELNRIAGSCAVTAVRAQIENTLTQFDEIDSVVILVEGREEDVLQP